jgi:hypothetical protein
MKYFLQDRVPILLRNNTIIDVNFLYMYETRYIVNSANESIILTFQSCNMINNDATASQIYPEVWNLTVEKGATIMIKKIADKELLLIKKP